jgi:hypothetical protein
MKITITEAQLGLIRRTYELEEIVLRVINDIREFIKADISYIRPDNFGVYESWVVNRVSEIFKERYPNIDYNRIDFLIFVSGQFNKEIRKGYNKVKKKK